MCDPEYEDELAKLKKLNSVSVIHTRQLPVVHCLFNWCTSYVVTLVFLYQYINPEQAELLSRKNAMNARSKPPAYVLSVSMESQKNSGSPGLKRRHSKERLTFPKLDMQKEREDMMHSLERLGEEQQESNGSYIVVPEPESESTNTGNSPPTVQHQDSLLGSPKLSKRLSTKMLAKVSMFEQAASSPPLPRTSTPMNSPQVNGPNEPSSE